MFSYSISYGTLVHMYETKQTWATADFSGVRLLKLCETNCVAWSGQKLNFILEGGTATLMEVPASDQCLPRIKVPHLGQEEQKCQQRSAMTRIMTIIPYVPEDFAWTRRPESGLARSTRCGRRACINRIRDSRAITYKLCTIEYGKKERELRQTLFHFSFIKGN